MLNTLFTTYYTNIQYEEQPMPHFDVHNNTINPFALGDEEPFAANFGYSYDKRTYKESDIFVSSRSVGLELELEEYCANIDAFIASEVGKCWLIVNDGSLRGDKAVEIVSAYPIGGYDLEQALTLLFEFEFDKKKLVLSSRTSVHIHVDVRDFTTQQLEQLIILYLVTERMLYKYAGAQRENSIFCIPDYMGRGLNTLLIDKAQSNESSGPSKYVDLVRKCHDNKLRYGGFNLAAILKQGSIEFRMLRGCFDKSVITEWVNILLSMSEYCCNNTFDVHNFTSEVSSFGFDEYLDAVFGCYSTALKYQGWEADFVAGLRDYQSVIVATCLEKPMVDRALSRLGYSVTSTEEMKKSPYQKWLDTNREAISKAMSLNGP